MKYELSHDSLARQVFGKASTEASTEARTRRKVERYVRERYAAYQERGAKLTQDDIDFITPYLAQVNISAAETAFIAAGRQALKRAQQRRRAIILGVITILSAISIIAIWQWRTANAAKEEANVAKNDALAAEADALQQKDEAIAARQDANAKADSLALQDLALQASLEEAQSARMTAEERRIQAERRTLEAEALALTARAVALPREEMATALRIAQAAWERAPEPPPSVQQAMSAIFYSQWGQPPNLPLYRKSLIGHTSWVYSAVFSPDGERILTASSDKTARVWPTPQRIYDYLKNEAAIPELTDEQRTLYGID